MQVTNHGMTSQISEISFTKPFLCAKNSRIYPSAKGDEDLIPWVGIIGVAFCQKILRFTICAVSFCHWDLEESGDSGLPVACWDTQLPKGKTHFSRIHGPRKIHLQQSHLQQPLLRQGVRGKFLGQNPLVERRWTFKMRIFLPPCGFITIQNRDDVWNHLENGPQHKSKGYLSLFQSWFVGRRVKNCPITIKQNQGNQWIYDNFSCASTIFQAPCVFGQSFRETFQNS